MTYSPSCLQRGWIWTWIFRGDGFGAEFSFFGAGYPIGEFVSEANSWFFDQMIKHEGRKNRQQQKQRRVGGPAEVLHRRQLMDEYPNYARLGSYLVHVEPQPVLG